MKILNSKKIIYSVAAIFVVLFAYVFYGYLDVYKQTLSIFDDFSYKVELLETSRLELLRDLKAEQSKNAGFEKEISSIASTIGVLDKLSKTDKQLLQKYSKVYFLNEHYVPESLVSIDKEFLYEPNRELKIHSKVEANLEKMLLMASSSGVHIKIVSAYRSFGEQSQLKNGYTLVYGSGANTFSADQGYSEHQLGTTLDFTTTDLGASFTKFASSLAYKWLEDNAYKYGFVLSYPDKNKYYQFEPWHWRYVGVGLATRLHDDGRYFYDLDQRDIDLYLVSIFD